MNNFNLKISIPTLYKHNIFLFIEISAPAIGVTVCWAMKYYDFLSPNSNPLI